MFVRVRLFSEAVAHGINAMITCLYFCWRADLVSQSSDPWAAASDEFSDMDGLLCLVGLKSCRCVSGGPENTAASMHMFCSWIVTIGWRRLLETHRNLTK